MPTPTTPQPSSKPTCFIAMPISTLEREAELYDDEDHWDHVLESLFVKAIEDAGFDPIRPATHGAHYIHGKIIEHLSNADLVLVDLSQHNPNVFFELGVRTSLNRPVALVKDEHTSIPFDTSGINTYSYSSSLRGWEMQAQQENLAKHVAECFSSCDGQNPLWRHFGLTIKATEPDAHESPLEAKVDLLTDHMAQLQRLVQGKFSSKEKEIAYTHNDRLSELLKDNEGTPMGEMLNELIHSSPASKNMDAFVKMAQIYIKSTGSPLELHPTDLDHAFLRITNTKRLDPEVVDRINGLADFHGIKLTTRVTRSRAGAERHPGQARIEGLKGSSTNEHG